MFGFFKQRRRLKLRTRPPSEKRRSIISRNFPLFTRLPADDQQELLGHVQVFLAEKRFEGCGGLQVTEEMQATIAAQACLLLLHRKTDYFPRLVTVLVYPSTYAAREERPVRAAVWEQIDAARLGETERHMGSLVLAWDAVKADSKNPSDGRNVVLHEFAHQLDYEDSVTDGAPALTSASEQSSWAKIMKKEFAALRSAVAADTPTLLDSYGATNAAEFFAVATEAFFERPRALQRQHPLLYGIFQRFYCQDPAQYASESSPSVINAAAK